MGTKLYFKCPGDDPVSRAVPEFFVCPNCGMDVAIWTDEIKGKCTFCNTVFQKNDTAKALNKKKFR